MPLRLALSLCLLLVASHTSAAATSVWQRYAETPGAVRSPVFALTVNGEAVPVEKFGDLHYARFMLSGPAELKVTVAGEPVKRALISPLSLKINAERKERTLTFTLAKPCGLFVRINNLESLLIFADFPETDAPKPDGQGVINIASYLPADRDPAAPITAALQRAIDDTSRNRDGQGGTLYLPNGRYVSGQLRLKSNVHLYLESGALLQSQTAFNPQDFPPQANRDSSFLFVENAQRVKISGRGIIDGNGYAVRTADPRANIKLLRTAGATDFTVEDIYFRDSARWSLHILDSERVMLHGFKLINDLRGQIDPKEKVHHAVVTNTDGVDIDASRHVTVEGAFLYTCDDAITPKVTNYMDRQAPCHDLVIRNNVFWTLKCALKVGDETIEDIHDILFANNYVIRADRVIALWSGDGGKIHDVRVFNNAVEMVGGDYNERFFHFRIRIRRPDLSRPGTIANVTVKDFFAITPAPQPSSLEGYDATHRITGVSFENIVIGGRRVRSAQDVPLTVRGFVDDPAFPDSSATRP